MQRPRGTPHHQILARACEVRTRLAAHGITRYEELDRIAELEGIVLVRVAGPIGKDAGMAHIYETLRDPWMPSLAAPGEWRRVWAPKVRVLVRSITINPNAGVPEPEVFWHEYYHLCYSPTGTQHSERLRHTYSTEGVLHHREERRADAFAAAVLMYDAITGAARCSMEEVRDQYGCSERSARAVVALRDRLDAE